MENRSTILQDRMHSFFELLKQGEAEQTEEWKNELQHQEAEMLREVIGANFYVPYMENASHMYASLAQEESKTRWLPAFTDEKEFQKMYDAKEWYSEQMRFDQLVEASGEKGIVIDPAGANFQITPENKEILIGFEEQIKRS